MTATTRSTVHRPRVALSSASVYPESASVAFLLAAELGYDGVELMVWADPVSQDPRAVRRLSRQYRMPVLSVHAPCLAVTQRVWSADPVQRLHLAAESARYLEARSVVVHPPFRWQRDYAREFADTVEVVADRHGVNLAVENMYPIRAAGLSVSPYAPSEDPTAVGHRHYTLDLSHTSAAGIDALELMGRMGDRLEHLHLADGGRPGRDEHLVPGRGTQPCGEVCNRLAERGFAGVVVCEVSTRHARTRHERAELLAHSLLFARTHLRPRPPSGRRAHVAHATSARV